MTFFSNTDLNTLREEGNDRNHFVSLIVNNEGTYTAAITRKVTREQDIASTYTYRSFNDLEVRGEGTSKVNEDIIVYNMLKIIKEPNVQDLFTEVDERINFIKEAKAKPTPVNTPSLYPYKQRTLFDEEYFDSEPPKTYISASMDPNELALSKESLPEAIIKSYTLQLLTGSIAISDTSKINIHQWANQMVSLFDRRFDKDLESFKLWIEVFGEFILFNFIPAEYSKYEDIYVEKLCTGIYNLLETLSENKYIKVIKDAILLWKSEY